MEREIKLDGGEITIIKAIGLSGSQLAGKVLLDRLGDLEQAELIDTMTGLMDQGFVLSSKVNVHSMEDMERASGKSRGVGPGRLVITWSSPA